MINRLRALHIVYRKSLLLPERENQELDSNFLDSLKNPGHIAKGPMVPLFSVDTFFFKPALQTMKSPNIGLTPSNYSIHTGANPILHEPTTRTAPKNQIWTRHPVAGLSCQSYQV
jgi:hypothetical protein